MNEIIKKCIKFYKLYIALFAISAFIALIVCAFMPPKYLASVTISSPQESRLSFNSGLLGAASISQQLTGSSESQQLFSYFVQSLTSQQAADILSDQYNLLPVVFHSKWDSSAKSWKQESFLRQFFIEIQSLLTKQQVKTHPNSEDLRKYLDNHISVRRVTPITSSGLLRSSDIIEVSFLFDNRSQAVAVLNDVLATSDNILRQNRQHDVGSRITYLHAALKKADGVEEREALIAAITSQQQEMAKISADKRYAYAIIVTAYSPLIPESPSPLIFLVVAILAGVVVGTAAIFLLPEKWFPHWIVSYRPVSGTRG